MCGNINLCTCCNAHGLWHLENKWHMRLYGTITIIWTDILSSRPWSQSYLLPLALMWLNNGGTWCIRRGGENQEGSSKLGNFCSLKPPVALWVYSVCASSLGVAGQSEPKGAWAKLGGMHWTLAAALPSITLPLPFLTHLLEGPDPFPNPPSAPITGNGGTRWAAGGAACCLWPSSMQ